MKRFKLKKLSLKQELLYLKARNEEMMSILDQKIFSSKTYKMWQFYNKIKRRILSIIGPVILSVIYAILAPLYLICIFIIFVVSYMLAQVTPKKSTLKLQKKDLKIDGVSFIIPTWNKGPLLVKCLQQLDSVASQEVPSIKKEIIVIDNGSSDDTLKLLSKLKLSIPLIVIPLEKNYSFAPAINIGVKKSSYNYVYLLNNDMFVQKGFLSVLYAFAHALIEKGNVFYGIASQIFFFKHVPRRIESGKTYYTPHVGSLYVAHCILHDSLQNPSITGYVGGGSSLIQKHVFEYLDYYDESLFRPLYVEDVDTSFRAWRMGFASYFLPSSSAIHHHQSSSKKLKKTPEYYIQKNLILLLLKNTTSLRSLLIHAVIFPLNIFLVPSTSRIILDTFKSSFDIVRSRTCMLSFPYKMSENEIIDFPRFEKEYEF